MTDQTCIKKKKRAVIVEWRTDQRRARVVAEGDELAGNYGGPPKR